MVDCLNALASSNVTSLGRPFVKIYNIFLFVNKSHDFINTIKPCDYYLKFI